MTRSLKRDQSVESVHVQFPFTSASLIKRSPKLDILELRLCWNPIMFRTPMATRIVCPGCENLSQTTEFVGRAIAKLTPTFIRNCISSDAQDECTGIRESIKDISVSDTLSTHSTISLRSNSIQDVLSSVHRRYQLRFFWIRHACHQQFN